MNRKIHCYHGDCLADGNVEMTPRDLDDDTFSVDTRTLRVSYECPQCGNVIVIADTYLP